MLLTIKCKELVTILSVLLMFGVLSSCNTSPSPETVKNALSDTIEESIDTTSINYFTLQCKHATPAQEIPLYLCEKYIKTALANKKLHPYLPLDKAIYNYGQIAYEDMNLVAITFYYKAVNDKNLLAASFMAIYDKLDGRCIDSKMVFGSSTFDFQKSKGYNMGLSYKSEMNFVDQDSVIFMMLSTEKLLYSKFKKGVPVKADEQTLKTFSLNTKGNFILLASE